VQQSATSNFGSDVMQSILTEAVDCCFQNPQAFHNLLELHGVSVEHLRGQHCLVVLAQHFQQLGIRDQAQSACSAAVVVAEVASVEGFLDTQDVTRACPEFCVNGV